MRTCFDYFYFVISLFFRYHSPLLPLVGPASFVVPFVACGDITGFDSDKSYPLQLNADDSYVYHEPVQPPIHPNYFSYQQRFGNNNQGGSSLEENSHHKL